MTPAGFEPTISAGERPKNYALRATGTGSYSAYAIKIPFNNFSNLSYEYPMKLSFHSQFLKPLTRRELTKFVLVQYYMLDTQLLLQSYEKQPVANVNDMRPDSITPSSSLNRFCTFLFSWACGITHLWRLSVSILSVGSHTWQPWPPPTITKRSPSSARTSQRTYQ